VHDNPYVGPASFTKEDSARFFGRAAETRELASLVIARRAVLLYAQSGAGKTSLLQASLIPELERRRRVETFPIARVTGSADTSSANLYVENALANLFPGGQKRRTFAEAFAAVLSTDATGRPQPHLLIFDQFEEIYTFHPELTDQRTAFFEQLGECLSTYPQLSLLLSMREDYLADLDANAALLPDRMRTRMRLERLGVESALDAIRGPAALAEMPFAAGAAEKLVDNLRRIRTGTPGSNAFALGQYVEPVQLQIVCRQLWAGIAADATRTKTTIDTDDIDKYARVDDALTQFYRDSLTAAKKSGVTERVLRRWFGEQLITAAGTRGLAFRSDKDTEGLSNEAVDILDHCHIIRTDLRGGSPWYELAHDRLVEPVREDNLAWKATYRNPLAAALERSKDTLLTGTGLAEALQFAKNNPQELNDEERLFVEKSEREERKTAVRHRRYKLIAIVVATLLLSLTTFALVQMHEAKQAEIDAEKDKTTAEQAEANAVQAKKNAEESEKKAVDSLQAEAAAKQAKLQDDVSNTWEALDATPCSEGSAGSWIVGVRLLYCEISHYMDMRRVEQLSGINIFLPGGPHGDTPNWKAKTFGHYNPAFVTWAAANLVPAKSAATQSVYTQYLQRDARIFLITYARLDKDPRLLTETANIYRGKIPPPVSIYPYWLDGLFINFPIDKDPDLKSLPPSQWRGKGASPQSDAYAYVTAMGFWARREVDGTRPLFLPVPDQAFTGVRFRLSAAESTVNMAHSRALN
jgi:hypothetical protein